MSNGKAQGCHSKYALVGICQVAGRWLLPEQDNGDEGEERPSIEVENCSCPYSISPTSKLR